jgi:hypothetical protein
MITIAEIVKFRRFFNGHFGKVAYSTRAEAFAGIRAVTARYAANPERIKDLSTMEPYPCSWGGEDHFHIGHRRSHRNQRTKKGKG